MRSSRRKVRFPSIKNHPAQSKASAKSTTTAAAVPGSSTNTGGDPSTSPLSHKNLPSRRSGTAPKMATEQQPPRQGVPSLFTQPPVVRNGAETETTRAQDETVQQCLPFLKGVAPTLYGPFNEHGIPSLYRDAHIAFLYDALEEYPGKFVGLDASRPWMMYWGLAGLYFLGEDVTKFRQRVISTATPMQNSTGGFGGGHGQMSHCASSYAVILSLAMVGGAEAFGLVDRMALGAYCVMVMIALLDLPIELPSDAPARQFGYDTFISGLPEYLSRCQTFEGGVSGGPGTEAHGAYAFCALACLCIMGSPCEMINNHWVGGCWPLIQAALNGTQVDPDNPQPKFGSLYSREGLTRYILGCCQSPHGGLRDKPGKPADSYHSCYTLAGLSNTQNYHFDTATGPVARGPFSSAFSWSHIPITSPTDVEPDGVLFHERDRLNVTHPLFVIPHSAAEAMRSWYESNPIPECNRL
ncbi:hypothetical protein UREG_00585 [Uncinocarpus reesii 1704]|uniref:Prenyltransferase alpha-alpha toroid domain-containing protein n=1 Tax=Uncinocarpus reesii (strain UAMH 1704) TaxID=336963 RepID=C4JDV8_UNCRE|nr:uncharacterized protein UREG_00585 [Uncinocarpus reesii 1704]EEP75738.1 hypothetical protein UREG_00585 [Uncinocarpus reesii 1704]